MKLVTFSINGTHRIGVVNTAGRVLDITSHGMPACMVDLIGLGPEALDAIAHLSCNSRHDDCLPLEHANLVAPIPRPRRNIFCIGKNYFSHAEEFHRSGYDATAGQGSIPALPIVFTKAPSTVIGTGAAIPAYLDETATTDYEGELGVVIGRGGRDISPEAAMDHVFGFTIINDVTARQLQREHKQWFIGKSIDGFCPMGPLLATKDELDPLSEVELRTFVNGELRQSAKLKDLIFDIPTIIAALAQRITLQAGDIIATGTPEGVGIGYKPPRFLKSGDRVRVEIDGLGILDNPVE